MTTNLVKMDDDGARDLKGRSAMRLAWGQFDPVSGELEIDGRLARLRPQTALLLGYLLRHAGRIVGKDELFREVWPGAVVTDDSLVQCIKEIRRAFGERRRGLVRTVPRKGYAIVDQDPMPDSQVETALSGGGLWAFVAGQRAAIIATTVASCVLAFALALPWPSRQPSGQPQATIVVLPFSTLAGSGPEWFAEGITEDLTTYVGFIPNTLVIARATADTFKGKPIDLTALGKTLGVRFAVEGSVERRGDDVQLHVRLNDTQSAHQLWARRFEGKRAGLGDMEREITAQVARALHLQLAETLLARSGRVGDATAQDMALEAHSLINSKLPAANARALELFEQALKRDAKLVSAWHGIAKANLQLVAQRWPGTDRVRALSSAQDAINRAHALDPDHVGVNGSRGAIFMHRKQFDEAIQALETETRIHPHHSLAYYYLGLSLIGAGQPAPALSAIEKAVRLSPLDPSQSGQLVALAHANMQLGRVNEAINAAQRAVAQPLVHRMAHLALAGALQMGSKTPDARAALQEFLRRQPAYTLEHLIQEELSSRPAFLEKQLAFREAVVSVGLPRSTRSEELPNYATTNR